MIQNSSLPDQKQYVKTNAYTKCCSIRQIIAIFVFLVLLTLHSNLLATILKINNVAFYLLLGLHYFFLLWIVGQYLYLTITDPADPKIKISKSLDSIQQNQDVHCESCCAMVSLKSFHCKSCDRCTQQFDHHCEYLNNCIGGQNYESFFRLLMGLICFTSVNIGEGGWILMQDSTDYKWVSLCLIILSSIVFLEVLVLFIFHLYVKYHLETSTYDYLKAEVNAQSNKVEDIPRQSKRESVKVHTIKNVHVQPGTSEIYEVTAGSLQREIV